MSIFDQIGKKVSDAGKGVAQQTKNLADVTKLNNAISAEEKRVLQICTDIGRMYYDRHKDAPDDEFAEQVAAITASLDQVRQWQEQIKQIKGVVKCTNCGAEMPHTSLFCPTCGTRVVQEPTPAPAPAPAVETKVCPHCGAAVNADDKFCTNCGTTM